MLSSEEDVVLFEELEDGTVLDRRILDEALSEALELAGELMLSGVGLLCVAELRAELAGALDEVVSVVELAANELDEWLEDALDEVLVIGTDDELAEELSEELSDELAEELLSVSGQ